MIGKCDKFKVTNDLTCIMNVYNSGEIFLIPVYDKFRYSIEGDALSSCCICTIRRSSKNGFSDKSISKRSKVKL